jgi:hypothetical protein
MRVAKVVSFCIALVLLLPHGESASGASESPAGGGTARPLPGTNLTRKAAKKEPSTLEKIGSGTKKFFSNIGDALTPGKKPAAKTATNPYTAAKKSIKSPTPQPEKKSWLSQLFTPSKTTTSQTKPVSTR